MTPRSLLAALILAGCGDPGGGDDTASAGGDDTAAAGADGCADAPVVTWENFGQGFLTENCQSCHASTSIDRYGAPEEVTFDSYEEALSWSERILARAAAEPPTMPPAGGTHEDDRELLRTWLTCWENP